MSRIYTLSLILATISSTVCADTSFHGPTQARVERVIDGDTVRMRVAIWIEQELVVSVRLSGVDAPELFRPKCTRERTLAKRAKIFVEEFLQDDDVTLRDIQRGKYAGRVVARIETRKGDLASALVDAGLAVKRTKGRWC